MFSGITFSKMKLGFRNRIFINSFINRRRIISSLLLGLGIGSIGLVGVESGYSQVMQRLTTSGILSRYPGHSLGNPITLNGQSYNDASYLNAYGDIVYSYYCPGVGGARKDGEYVWNVVEQRYNPGYSIINISGQCANGSGTVPAGAFFWQHTMNHDEPFIILGSSQNQVNVGQSFTINWKSNNIQRMVLMGDLNSWQRVKWVSTNGSEVITHQYPGTYSYTLIGYGPNWERVTKTITVQVNSRSEIINGFK